MTVQDKELNLVNLSEVKEGELMIVDKVKTVLAKLSSFDFSKYSNQASLLGTGLGVLLLLDISNSVLHTLESLPLIGDSLELVGLVYTAYFVNRYLLKEENRKEFLSKVEELKVQVLGK